MEKNLAVPFLIALSVTFALMPLYVVSAQGGPAITTIVPPSQTGKVGDPVRILGNIGTANGAYQIWFGNKLVVSNTSTGVNIDANFPVPELPGGAYAIILRDVSSNINATQPFNVETGYYVKALVPSAPAQLQEGSNVTLNVTITGTQPSTSHSANITVQLPTPLSTSYSQIVQLSLSSPTGVANALVTYPGTTFQPSGAVTDYVGLYQVYFNQSQSLATDQFFISFTDLSQYHRGQSVTIQAIGYQPNENSTITITNLETGVNVHSEEVTASSAGVINAVWAVPTNAKVGIYNFTITPLNTLKLLSDRQIFTVPGYPIIVRTLNLGGGVVPQIVVEALDQAANTTYSNVTGSDGIAILNLESGSHTLAAFWNDVKVGEINASITGAGSFDLPCTLTNLKMTVRDKNGIPIPFVNLDLTYQYVTTKEGLSKTGRASGQTDLSGTSILNSTLPGIGYTINASIYGKVFNAGNNTLSNLSVQPVSEVIILCPSRTLTLTIFDYNRAALTNARIELVELTSGIFYAASTDSAGTVTMDVTFGKYKLRVYTGDILLNETVVEVFSDTKNEIRCSLYNIQISITVVDYFGQPIPNIHAVLHGPGSEALTATTQNDGTATFTNVIGGKLQVIAYPAGMENSYEAVNLQVEEPTSIQIKMTKYVLLGPFLIETNVLATFIIILAPVILFLSIEVYRRKRVQSGKTESEN